MGRVRVLVATTTLGALLALPAQSSGTVTIGSNLGGNPSIGIACAGSLCTRVQTSLPADRLAANGVASPVNGTVVRWRVRTNNDDTQRPIAFRVISPASGGQYTGGASSPTVTPPATTGVSTFAASVPVKLGDLVGLNFNNNFNFYFRLGGGPASGQLFNPSLAQGTTRSPQTNTTEELLVNADIEATATLTSVKAKSKKRGKLKVTMEAPNPGTLFATGKGIHSSTTQVAAAGPLKLVVKPYQVAKRKVADGKTVKTKLKLTFTPFGGSAEAQTLKVKLKP